MTMLDILRLEIDKGIEMATDPANINLPELAQRITTKNSPWFMEHCPTCRNLFRIDDRVRLCPICEEAYHDDPQFELNCWHQKYGEQQPCGNWLDDELGSNNMQCCDYVWEGQLPIEQTETAATPEIMPSQTTMQQFVGGVRTIWQPFSGQPVLKVNSQDVMVGRKCPWCRFNIRVGDWVIACPCGCGTYFHEDVFRHLTCWNEWNGAQGKRYCPNTLREFTTDEQ